MDNNQNNAVWNGTEILDRGHVVGTPQGAGYYMGSSYEGEQYCKVVINRVTLDVLLADLYVASKEDVEKLLEIQEQTFTN